MAISKNRLEELIKQKATIYGKIYGEILPIELSEKNKPEIKYDDRLDVHCSSDEYRNKLQFCYLWETKEDAEFELRYKHISRTEYLDLPTWEEFCKVKDLGFYGATHTLYHIFSDLEWLWLVQREDDEEWSYDLFCERATKDNYIKACELCRKLFLGEVE